MTLKELAKSYVDLREKKRLKEVEVDDISQEMEQVEQQMIPMMRELEAQNLKMEGVGTIYLKTVPYAAVVKGKEDEFVTWLDEHGQGALASRKVHASTLKSQYQKWTEDDMPLPPEELVTAFLKTTVHVNKSAVKQK